MDRAGQLRNVAFGGSWSEQIAGREELLHALETLKRAARRAALHDPREDIDVGLALDLASRDHPKGAMLRAAWARGAAIAAPGSRVAELGRVAGLLAEAYRGRL
ncbi:hypothetical protein EQ718_13815 (plasmid) [Paracoccus versutus]|uniref:Uncharacterized protein n=1 Tax=Paracoccus versutus TaxID=34007 RepID=A0AAQ0HEG0_PARVE|nr:MULTISPECIES: hypothetical protein [Paracoccus]REG35226.1 hypothetical protein ATH84_103738 [Paracoccus versutus]WEJ80004.1 hypothetical protein EQ718_13815 [Paracoccus versutus]